MYYHLLLYILFANLKSSMPAHYKYFNFFFLVKSSGRYGSDHLESICYYGDCAPLLFSCIHLCSLYFLLLVTHVSFNKTSAKRGSMFAEALMEVESPCMLPNISHILPDGNRAHLNDWIPAHGHLQIFLLAQASQHLSNFCEQFEQRRESCERL